MSNERGGARERDLSEVGMRRYDDPVEVRRGMVPGVGGPVEGPEQFLWHGRLWKVYEVVSHWWRPGRGGARRRWRGSSAARSADGRRGLGVRGAGWPRSTTCSPSGRSGGSRAGRGIASGRGVFDLVFDWAQGSWLLTRCLD
jgi:hypothetical protein